MEIGKLKHRVILEAYTTTRDSFGAEIKDWIEVGTVWANIEPVSGKEYFSSKQINAEVTTKITIRHLAEINPKMRVLFKNRIFEVISVINPEEKNIALIFMCKESVPDG